MRWILRRTGKTDTSGSAEALRCAEARLRDVEGDLERAHARTSEIAEISRTLRRLGEHNHFARAVLEALGGGPR